MLNRAKADEICRRHGISSATFYTRRKKYGGMEASDARRLKALEVTAAIHLVVRTKHGRSPGSWQSGRLLR